MYCFHLNNTLSTFTNFWSSTDFFLNKSIPIGALIAIPALLIAVFVPITIFMMDKKDNVFAWDKAVIFKNVLQARKIFIGIIAFTIIPVLWGWGEIKVILLFPFVWFIVVIFLAVIESYKWLVVIETPGQSNENYRTNKRKEFLATLSDQQKQIIWPLTWGLDKSTRGLIDERELINIFVKNMESTKELNANVLRSFINNLDQVNIVDPIVHQALINFSMKNAKNLVAHIEDEDTERLDFGFTARDLYFELLKRDLENDFGLYLFFSHTRKYLKDINADEKFFVNQFSPQFLSVLDNIGSVYKIWDQNNFPADWKITTENLTNSTVNPAVFEWLTSYLHWISSRNMLTTDPNEFKYDNTADQVTEGLLPKIDPPLWSDIVAFHWSSFGAEIDESPEHAQIRGFIERSKRFGLIGRTYSWWGEYDESKHQEDQKQAVQETFIISATTTAFPLLLNKDKLKSFLKELDEFKNETDKDKIEKIQRLRYILTEIDSRISKQ